MPTACPRVTVKVVPELGVTARDAAAGSLAFTVNPPTLLVWYAVNACGVNAAPAPAKNTVGWL